MLKAVLFGAAHSVAFIMSRAAKKSGKVELVGVYDSNDQVAAAAAERLETARIPSLDEALACKPALALIGSDPPARVDLAERALAVGAAALVDNPLVVTHEAMDQLVEAQKRYARPVITYQPYRGDPLVLAAKAAFDAGRIGRLVRVLATAPHKARASRRPAWHWTRAGNGGILIDIGSHGIDLACWLAADSPEWICSLQGNWTQPDHPEFQDFAQTQISFANGVLANLEADWLATDSLGTFGDSRLWLQGTEGKIELYKGDQVWGRIWTKDVAGEPLDASGYPGIEDWNVKLIEALAQGQDCGIPQQEVWEATRVSLLAFDSAQKGGQPVAWT